MKDVERVFRWGLCRANVTMLFAESEKNYNIEVIVFIVTQRKKRK